VLTRLKLLRSAEAGFTLVELLVAMVAGIIVMIALFTILDVTLTQTSRVFTITDSTQRARTALDLIEEELHSACLASGETPIQVNSSATSLIFLSQYGNAVNPTPVEHAITLSGGTLTDTTYAETGGSAPNWTFSSTASGTTTLLQSAGQSGSTPVFQYFAYQEVPNGSGGYYSDSNGDPYEMLVDGANAVPGTSTVPAASPLSIPLSTTTAASAAEVVITLSVGPNGGTGEKTNLSDANTTETDAVVLRLTPDADHQGAGNTFLPCQ
jgi:Tfp pilus assembly protein PilW